MNLCIVRMNHRLDGPFKNDPIESSPLRLFDRIIRVRIWLGESPFRQLRRGLFPAKPARTILKRKSANSSNLGLAPSRKKDTLLEWVVRACL